jgi:NAD(P)H-hydrate epimerase
MSKNVSLISRRTHPTILTPHAGELGTVMGQEASAIDDDRVEAARRAAKSFRCIVCLKGSPTVTALPSGKAFLNSTGNPGMATIGSGDVLTGVIASLLGQRMTPEAAAYSGVFLHGFAGDLAARNVGERSLMAMDILNHVPDALRSLEKK